MREPKETPGLSVPDEVGQGPCKTLLSGDDPCDRHSFGSEDGFLDEQQVRSLLIWRSAAGDSTLRVLLGILGSLSS